MVINKSVIKVLKDADCIILRRDMLEAISVVGKDDIGVDIEQVTKLRINSNYTDRDGRLQPGVPTCCYVDSCAKYDHYLQTVFDLLREGDDLSIRWGRDDFTNNYLEQAEYDGECGSYHGMHCDTVSLVVNRKDQRFEFLIHAVVCPDNSARMIIPDEGVR